MTWPKAADYIEAVQTLRQSMGDEELRAGELTLNQLGLPMAWSGGVADVYKIHNASTGTTWALKCFTKRIDGQAERYRHISAHLEKAHLPFLVDFRYLDQGIRVRGQWYPVVKMRWVEGGIRLNEFVKQCLDRPKALNELLQVWLKMASRLRRAAIGHCDLQHGNVLLVPRDGGKLALRLIDYDGVHVPALAGTRSPELGHPAFQHPQRSRDQIYSAEVDRFSHLAIYTGIHCLTVGRESLWKRFNNDENLLFREEDFRCPGKSEVFRTLWKLPDAASRALVGRLALACELPLEHVPLLDEAAGARIKPLTSAEEHAVESLLGTAPDTHPSAVADLLQEEPALAMPEGIASGAQLDEAEISRRSPFSRSAISLLGQLLKWLSPLNIPRAIDRGLKKVAGEDNAILHNFMRVVTAAVLLLAFGFFARSHFQSSEPSLSLQEASQTVEPDSGSASEGDMFPSEATSPEEERPRESVVHYDAASGLLPQSVGWEFEDQKNGPASEVEVVGGVLRHVVGSANRARWNLTWDDVECPGAFISSEARVVRLTTMSQREGTQIVSVAYSRDGKTSIVSLQGAQDKVVVTDEIPGPPLDVRVLEEIPVEGTEFHDYRIELGESGVYRILIDGNLKAQGTARVFDGDGSGINGRFGDWSKYVASTVERKNVVFGELSDSIELDEGFPSATRASAASDLPERFSNQIGMEFKRIPAGEFLMGSPNRDPEKERNETPQHRVQISEPFCLGIHEVTQEQYEQVMGENPSRFKGPNRPVEQVSWAKATEFCLALSGRDPEHDYRLPTEAEWEYACRAGTTTRFCCGDSLDARVSWYNQNSSGMTHPVGEKEPNAWGLYDMHGNVWEWCQDRYDDRYYSRAPQTDPTGAISGSKRVCRGGSALNTANQCRSAFRDSLSTDTPYFNHGFRVVCFPDAESGTENGVGPAEGPVIETHNPFEAAQLP